MDSRPGRDMVSPDCSWIPAGSMNNPPFGPFDKLMVLSLSKDFDYGLLRPPLRANLESLDSARDPELVEGQVRSTVSKPATKIFKLLRVLIHESNRFVNNAG